MIWGMSGAAIVFRYNNFSIAVLPQFLPWLQVSTSPGHDLPPLPSLGAPVVLPGRYHLCHCR